MFKPISLRFVKVFFLCGMLIANLVCPPAVHAQFITLARKIKAKHTPQADVATVVIDAKTYRVYEAVIDTLTTNGKFKISQRNNEQRLVEFTNGTMSVSMKVDSLAPEQARVTATAPVSESSDRPVSDVAIKAVVAVCQKLGIKYTIEKE
jgi:hypothetical protein